MSKKSKKATQTHKPVTTRPQSAVHAGPVKGRSHPHKESAQVNLMAVQIVATVLAALCLAGIVAILITQPAPFTGLLVIEVILLAFITGFCVFTAVRPQGTVRWFSRLGR